MISAAGTAAFRRSTNSTASSLPKMKSTSNPENVRQRGNFATMTKSVCDASIKEVGLVSGGRLSFLCLLNERKSKCRFSYSFCILTELLGSFHWVAGFIFGSGGGKVHTATNVSHRHPHGLKAIFKIHSLQPFCLSQFSRSIADSKARAASKSASSFCKVSAIN